MSERVQRSRTKGWRKPPNSVIVSRPALWGNPWTVRDAPDWIYPGWDGLGIPPWESGRERTPRECAEWAVAQYRGELEHWGLMSDYSVVVSEARWDALDAEIIATGAQNMREYAAIALRGKTLVCWCPLVDADGAPWPCHGDVLLQIANA